MDRAQDDGPRAVESEREQRARERVTRALQLREGSHVRRFHTMPLVGEYLVGQHCHDALTLLLLLYPGDPSLGLVRAVHWHDAHERYTGDVPRTATWNSRALDLVLDDLQNRVRHRLGIHEDFLALTEEEREWLRAVDILELWLFCCDQVAMGNRHLEDVMRRIEAWFEETDVPDPVRDFVENFEWRREEDVLEP